jgi:SMI1/KNR4 family protein SUKH-1
MWESFLESRGLQEVTPEFLAGHETKDAWSAQVVGQRAKGRDGKWRRFPPVSKPSAADIDAAEKAIGVALPASYRAFCMQLGPGTLADLYRIYAPCSDWPSMDLATNAIRCRDSWPRPGQPYAYPFPVQDLVAFANTLMGDNFGFYPKEPTHGDEYAVYAVLREPPPESMIARVADSFVDFIDNVVLDRRMMDLGIFVFEAGREYRTWEPLKKRNQRKKNNNRK